MYCDDQQGWTGNCCYEATQHTVIINWWLLRSDPTRCNDEQGWAENCCCEVTQCAAVMNRDGQATDAVKRPSTL